MRDLSEWLRGWSRETPFRLALGPSFEHGHRSVTAGTVGDLRDALAAADRVHAELNAARADLTALAMAAGQPGLVTDPKRLAALITGLRAHYDADRRLTAPTLETPRA